MPTCWDESLEALTVRPEDWSGVWSIAYAVGREVQRLASVDGSDEDLTLTYAGLDVALAVSELEWADPTGTARAIDIDLGLGNPARDAAIRRLSYLINHALVLISALTSGGKSTSRQVQAGMRAWALLFRAQETLAGRGS
ncbi:MAG: hypothetical protein KQH57_18710 [Actinomycetales bacterium]|nr:hypothetical protein [Actinomycetales bacterium]